MSVEETTESIDKLADFDIDEDDEIEIGQEIFATFGNLLRDDEAHRRAVRFLSACVNRYLWTWESLGCELPGPELAATAVSDWLQTGNFSENFAYLCIPVIPSRNGQPVQDCDEPALSDRSGASSRLAYFCKTRNIMDATIVLANLFWADAEGLQPNDELEFVEWLSTEGVKIAWEE